MSKTTSTDVVTTTGVDLNELTFSELMSMMDAGTVSHIQDIDELRKIEKAELVGKPFVITSWRYNPDGDMGDFMVVQITTKDDEKLFFVDGSTGIKDQLLGYQEKMDGAQRPIFVPKGLRVSNYTYKDEISGKDIPASTYYINNES
jgi:hypothetical protein